MDVEVPSHFSFFESAVDDDTGESIFDDFDAVSPAGVDSLVTLFRAPSLSDAFGVRFLE